MGRMHGLNAGCMHWKMNDATFSPDPHELVKAELRSEVGSWRTVWCRIQLSTESTLLWLENRPASQSPGGLAQGRVITRHAQRAGPFSASEAGWRALTLRALAGG